MATKRNGWGERAQTTLPDVRPLITALTQTLCWVAKVKMDETGLKKETYVSKFHSTCNIFTFIDICFVSHTLPLLPPHCRLCSCIISSFLLFFLKVCLAVMAPCLNMRIFLHTWRHRVCRLHNVLFWTMNLNKLSVSLQPVGHMGEVMLAGPNWYFFVCSHILFTFSSSSLKLLNANVCYITGSVSCGFYLVWACKTKRLAGSWTKDPTFH